MSFGLTDEGFVAKTLTDVEDGLATALENTFGKSIKARLASSVAGQLVGIFAAPIAELWDVGESLYHVVDPDAATGAALDQICAITGTVRKPSSVSKASVCYLIGNSLSDTVVPAGSVASVTGTGDRFVLTADQTIQGPCAAWTPTTTYGLHSVVTNDSGKLYACTQSGTSAGSGGPTGTGTAIVDGGVVWYYIGTATSATQLNCEFDAEETGAIPAAAGTLTTIETPVAGWSGVINIADASLGSSVDSDVALRARRESELAPGGAAVPDAIRTAVLKVSGVTSCVVYYNDTDTIDGNGTAGHGVQVLVLGGADADIAAALWETVPTGISTTGTTTASTTDSEGTQQFLHFTRPTAVPIYVTVTLTYDATAYPSDGDTEVKNAIVALGDAYPIGKDVTAWAMGAPLDSVPGILDVSSVKIGTSPSPAGSTTISIDGFHLATFDTSRIVVTSTPGTP